LPDFKYLRKKHATALCKVEVAQSIKFCNVLLGFKISRDHLTERFSQSGNNIIYFLLSSQTVGILSFWVSPYYPILRWPDFTRKATAYPSGANSGDPPAYFALASVTKKKVL
jgi:hypothetical protein